MKKLFFSKRANSAVKKILNALMGVVVAALIMFSFVTIGRQFANGEMFDKLFIVKLRYCQNVMLKYCYIEIL